MSVLNRSGTFPTYQVKITYLFKSHLYGTLVEDGFSQRQSGSYFLIGQCWHFYPFANQIDIIISISPEFVFLCCFPQFVHGFRYIQVDFRKADKRAGVEFAADFRTPVSQEFAHTVTVVSGSGQFVRISVTLFPVRLCIFPEYVL